MPFSSLTRCVWYYSRLVVTEMSCTPPTSFLPPPPCYNIYYYSTTTHPVRFGTEFLNKFEASLCPSPVLEKIFFIDSPGVLAGEKQKLGRSYEFAKVMQPFAPE